PQLEAKALSGRRGRAIPRVEKTERKKPFIHGHAGNAVDLLREGVQRVEDRRMDLRSREPHVSKNAVQITQQSLGRGAIGGPRIQSTDEEIEQLRIPRGWRPDLAKSDPKFRE